MPVQLDLLTRVRNIKWATPGAIFVIGDDAGYIWYCKVKNKTSEPTPLENVGDIDPTDEDASGGDPGVFMGSSFAVVGEDKALGIKGKATFVIGGTTGFMRSAAGSRLQPKGKILLSHDGREWEQVFSEERHEPNEFIWDAEVKQFFAWMSYRELDRPGVDGAQYSECWSSSTGYEWTLVDSTPGNVFNPVFESHCPYKWKEPSKDDKGFADGKFGFDPAFVHPATKVKGLLKTVEDEEPPGYTQAMTFAARIWARGGNLRPEAEPGYFEVSVDDTVTWKVVGQVPQPEDGGSVRINTVIGGPLKDIPQNAGH